MKLAIGLACLLLAALLAAVGWVLARPRWRWEAPTVDEWEPSIPDWSAFYPPARPGALPYDTKPTYFRPYSSGSPESVTSRADNGTGFDPRLMGA